MHMYTYLIRLRFYRSVQLFFLVSIRFFFKMKFLSVFRPRLQVAPVIYSNFICEREREREREIDR